MADTDGVQFTHDSARRIAAVVREAEREPTDLTGEAPRRPRPQVETIFARLTEVDDGAASWEEVYLSDDGETWTAADRRTGDKDGDGPAYFAVGGSGGVGDVVTLKRAPLSDGEGGWTLGWVVVAGSIPKPTARYQVYTPVDDTLAPVWTTARFTEGGG